MKSCLVALFLAGLTGASGLSQEPPLPLEAFARLPQMELAAISPDGRRVAHVSDIEGTRILAILELETRQTEIIRIDTIRAEHLRWADNETVLLSASEAQRSIRWRGVHDVTNAFAIRVDDDFEVVQLLARDRNVGVNLNLGRILGIADGGARVVMPAYNEDGSLDLFAARTDRAFGRRIERGSALTTYWVVGEDGAAIARIDRSEARDRQVLYVYEDGSPREIYRQDDTSQPTYTAWGVLPGGDLAISTTFSQSPAATRGLYALSLENGTLTGTIFENDTLDLESVIADPYSNRVIGVTYQDVFPTTVWFDDYLSGVQDALLGGLGADAVSLVSWSQDRDTLLARAHWADRPSVTYLIDWPERHVSPLAVGHALPTDGSLAVRQHITYPARDGTLIPAYLTLPDGDAPHPTIVLPHGGPASRESGGFDFIAHFLASRGYAVIQPDFRGSDGYGLAWERAGDAQWGIGLMQHDITDAATALVAAGFSDPDRICIGGFSYGGYAALAGATFTPDVYQCAFAMAPVSDLGEMIGWIESSYGRNHWVYQYWANILADSDDVADRALDAASPARHAEQVRAPILLIHGEDDTVVPIRQSQIMASALQRADADFEFMVLDEADHWLSDAQTRRAVLGAMETFFDEHIGD